MSYLLVKWRASKPPGTLLYARKPSRNHFTITVIMVTIKMTYNVHGQLNHDHGHHLIELVLIEDDVEHLGWALGKLLRRHQLHVDVPGLGLQSAKCKHSTL